MKKIELLSSHQRLIVAADFEGRSRRDVESKVLSLARSLEGMGVILKVNSALRACGYKLIDKIHDCGLKVFADLKLNDIPLTLKTDGEFLAEAKPELLTVMCNTGHEGMRSLEQTLSLTEILGVTILTSLTETDCLMIYGCSIKEAVDRLAGLAVNAGMHGIVCSPKEVEDMQWKFGEYLSLNTPAIRPLWTVVKVDDQNPDRIMTPEKAIRAGADRIIVGRPIVQSADPRSAVLCTIEEIESVLSVTE